MNAFAKTLTAALFAIASFCASAQTAPAATATVAVTTADSPELVAKKAAAKELLSRETLAINLVATNRMNGKMATADLEARPLKGTFMFWNTGDSTCQRPGTPTVYSIDDQGNIMMNFTWPVAGCREFIVKIDPQTKIGATYSKDAQGVFVKEEDRVLTIK